jgi:hypothetical protein
MNVFRLFDHRKVAKPERCAPQKNGNVARRKTANVIGRIFKLADKAFSLP